MRTLEVEFLNLIPWNAVHSNPEEPLCPYSALVGVRQYAYQDSLLIFSPLFDGGLFPMYVVRIAAHGISSLHNSNHDDGGGNEGCCTDHPDKQQSIPCGLPHCLKSLSRLSPDRLTVVFCFLLLHLVSFFPFSARRTSLDCLRYATQNKQQQKSRPTSAN